MNWWEQAALLSEKLATIKCDIDLQDVSLEDLRTKLDKKEAQNVLDELEFNCFTWIWTMERKKRLTCPRIFRKLQILQKHKAG